MFKEFQLVWQGRLAEKWHDYEEEERLKMTAFTHPLHCFVLVS